MKYLIIGLIFLSGCAECPKDKITIQKLKIRSCSFGKCSDLEKTEKLCEIERIGNKCKYSVQSLGDTFWGECPQRR